MMRALAVMLLALAMPAVAQAPARALIDCGTLQGSGTVRFIIGDTIFLVRIECTRA